MTRPFNQSTALRRARCITKRRDVTFQVHGSSSASSSRRARDDAMMPSDMSTPRMQTESVARWPAYIIYSLMAAERRGRVVWSWVSHTANHCGAVIRVLSTSLSRGRLSFGCLRRSCEAVDRENACVHWQLFSIDLWMNVFTWMTHSLAAGCVFIRRTVFGSIVLSSKSPRPPTDLSSYHS